MADRPELWHPTPEFSAAQAAEERQERARLYAPPAIPEREILTTLDELAQHPGRQLLAAYSRDTLDELAARGLVAIDDERGWVGVTVKGRETVRQYYMDVYEGRVKP